MKVSKKTVVRGFGNIILGYIEEDTQGNKQVRSRGGKILGYYNKNDNTTRSFGNTIVAYGDICSGFLLPANLRG